MTGSSARHEKSFDDPMIAVLQADRDACFSNGNACDTSATKLHG
jgi:hypothetical protein